MGLPKNIQIFLIQLIIAEVRITLGDGNILVPGQFLGQFEVAGGLQDGRDEIVPERVGRDGTTQPPHRAIDAPGPQQI